MTDEMSRRWPAAVLVAVAVQAAAALMWGGAASARIAALEARAERQGTVIERLARLEEQVTATRAAVERMERRIERGEA
jgi:hypothetical protein